MRTARVGVVGLGYVGLPLAVELARAGFRTTGIDLDGRKVDAINRGESYIQDVPGKDVAQFQAAQRLEATTEPAVVARLDTVNICVPTPLRKTKDPDLSYVVSAVEMICRPPSSRHAGGAGIDHLSRYYGGSRPADSGAARPEGGQGFFSGVLARARGSGQREMEHEERAEGRRRPDTELLGARPGTLFGFDRHRHRSRLTASRRDGETAREHVSCGQYRPRERTGADVRPARHECVGGG